MYCLNISCSVHEVNEVCILDKEGIDRINHLDLPANDILHIHGIISVLSSSLLEYLMLCCVYDGEDSILDKRGTGIEEIHLHPTRT